MRNEDVIDESHKSQLKFECDVHLVNYTINIKTPKNLNWTFEVFRFLKNLKHLGF